MGTAKRWETRRKREQEERNEWTDAALLAGAEEAAKVCDRLADQADADADRSAHSRALHRARYNAFREAADTIRKEVRP
jgi:phage shock protein A